MKAPIEANLTGAVAVVTGASSGIGKEVARDLARLRATVILACRDEARGRAALDDIVADTGNHRTELELVDTSSQVSIRAFARRVAERFPAVHILVNNAGIWASEPHASVDGIELTWATNVLGYFLVTRELLPLLERGGASLASAPFGVGPAAGGPRTARIVNVASLLARGLDVDDVEMRRRGYAGVAAHAQSKQAVRMLTAGLAARLAGKPVTVNAMHPGMICSNLASRERGLMATVGCCAFRMFGKAPADGADTASWLAASPDVEGKSGRLWVDRRERACEFAGDAAAIDALWARCVAMTAPPSGPQPTSSTTLPKPSLLAT